MIVSNWKAISVAYSNWGAFVHEGGVRREDREDVAVFNDDEATCPSGGRIYANILKNMERYPDGNPPWYAHSHHAVLGDGPIRLCGYKCRPELWRALDDENAEDIDLAPYLVSGDRSDPDCEELVYEGDVDGCHFYVREYDGNMVELLLIEADGSRWHSICGYVYGAGHLEYDAARHAPRIGGAQ